MDDPMITVRPNGADMMRFSGTIASHHTETGWMVEMHFTPASPDVTREQVVSEAADVAVGESHFGGQVTEYDPLTGRIVVEGPGPAPVP
jgi:hypothetical protein